MELILKMLKMFMVSFMIFNLPCNYSEIGYTKYYNISHASEI